MSVTTAKTSGRTANTSKASAPFEEARTSKPAWRSAPLIDIRTSGSSSTMRTTFRVCVVVWSAAKLEPIVVMLVVRRPNAGPSPLEEGQPEHKCEYDQQDGEREDT